MDWSTEEEKRQDEEKRQKQLQADKRLLAALDELRKKALEAKKIEAKKRKKSKTSRKSKIPKRSLLLSKKSRERSLQMQVSEEEDTPRLFDADALSEGTPSSPHSWMHSDQATQSLHSWMPEEDAAVDPLIQIAMHDSLVSLEPMDHGPVIVMGHGSPESPHSWMHDAIASP